MKILSYLLITTLLIGGCGSVVKEEPKTASEEKTPRNYDKLSAEELLPLAEQGDAEARYNLGTMYNQGKGVPKDNQLAVKWFRKAAEQGDAKAQNILGLMYDMGEGVPQDYILAHKWLNVAAAQGQKNAPKWRDDIAKNMILSQIQEAQRLTREFKPKKEKP